MMMRKIIFLISLFLIVGISDVHAIKAPMPKRLSSKAEAIFPGITKRQILDALTNEMLSRGFTIKSTTDYTIVYGKIDDDQRNWVIFGVRPESRISYDIVDVPKGVRVVATQQMVSNPNTNRELITDFSYYENVVDLQRGFLLSIKSLLEKK